MTKIAGSASPGNAMPEKFLLVAENASLPAQVRTLLETLLGRVSLEVVPEDGPLVLSRLRIGSPRLAFLPMRMRHLEALTLLRMLGAKPAQSIVLLVPETLEGFGMAWDALGQGACDFIATKGRPPERLHGEDYRLLRQLAILLAERVAPEWREELRSRRIAALRNGPEGLPSGIPVVLLPETRHLREVAGHLMHRVSDAPVVVRVPGGPKLRRVVRRELARLCPRPVRDLVAGDRLAVGQIHLFSEPQTLRLEATRGRIHARLIASRKPPGSWDARKELLKRLGESSLPLQFLLGGSMEPEEQAVLLQNGAEPRYLGSFAEREIVGDEELSVERRSRVA